MKGKNDIMIYLVPIVLKSSLTHTAMAEPMINSREENSHHGQY